ncbi:MAG: AI-2E family transporter [Alphaproteobacteria bacterium]|nr:AI-2E family transporter [Alphaproteobacteria bacterium]
MMTRLQIRFWLIGLAVFIGLVYLLRPVLLPFVAGMAAAYFLDPIVDRLERYRLGRSLATGLVTIGFFVIFGGVIALMVPMVQTQVMDFAHKVPEYAEGLRDRLRPLAETLLANLNPEDVAKLKATAESYAGTMVSWIITAIGNVLTGGMALLSILSLLLITPVVTFYLLRDWDKMTARVDSWLPRDHAETIRGQLHEIDSTLAGFVRGQALVCTVLALFYGVGFSLAGLDLGLVVGIATGIATVVPYLGGILGMVLSVGLALAQFSDWMPVVIVAAVSLTGQVIEGYVLTPNLVGDRIRLHPVWIPFALLAGGALFGFLGVLLAVPVAAVIGVLVRFSLERYLASPVYRGNSSTSEK